MEKPPQTITYDLPPTYAAPQVGQFVVSIGKQGVNSVYHIGAVRVVKSKALRETVRYALGVYPAPDLKPVTVYDPETNVVWVRGTAGFPLFWYPRGKKKV